ncbi:MAG: hypothetical protein LBG76_10250, partial [Treponema sp.]|nr:hypothetical protein [Treponema sp.]
MKKPGGAGKRPPVFTKIFAYTLLLLVLMGLAVGGLFARQFISFYHLQQERQLAFSLRPVINAIEDKPLEEVVEIARAFAERNQSFKFLIRRNDGDVVFATPGTPAPELEEAPLSPPLLETRRQRSIPVEAAEGRQRGLPEDQGAASQAEENNGRFILRLSATAAPSPQDAPGKDMPIQVAMAVSRPPGGGEESYTLTGFISFSSRLAYGDLVGRCLLALA